MDDWVFNIEHVVVQAQNKYGLGSILNRYLAKQIWNKSDRRSLLEDIATYLLKSNKKDAVNFAHALGPIALDLMHRCEMLIMKDTEDDDRIVMRRQFGILLGELIQVNFPTYLEMIAVDYFIEHCECFFNNNFWGSESNPQPCKRRRTLPDLLLDTALPSISHIFKKRPVVSSLNWCWKELYQCVMSSKDDLSSTAIAAFIDILSIILQLPLKVVNELHSSAVTRGNAIQYVEYRNCSRQAECIESLSESRLFSSKKKLSHTKRAFTSADFTDRVSVVSGMIIHNPSPITLTQDSSPKSSGFVLTNSAEKCLKSLSLAVANRHPVVLLGQAGCGKTSLIKYFVKTLMGKNLIEVQLGEGVDSKVLSGMYKCTVVSGEFEWQPGVLTQAVRDGDWILLEDIDKAPLDVVSLLLPLLEYGILKISGHTDAGVEQSSFSSGFRIFMTCRMSSDQNPSSNPCISKLCRHSRCIDLETPSHEDLKTIIAVKFPKIKHLAEKLLEIYMKLEDIYMELTNSRSNSCRRFTSIRDLFRLCNRVNMRLKQDLSEGELGQVVAMETVDCLVASSMSDQEKNSKIHSAFALLNLSTSNADYFCQSYRPELVFQKTQARFGRVSLLPNINDHAKINLFALTRSSSILLERIACAVEMCEPVLLVGETGVGKTSAIQYLANKLGHSLHVVNISQQSSSSDLLGAFKPVQLKHLIAPVRNRFEKLFVQTFSRQTNERFLTHIQSCFLNKKYDDLLQLMIHCSSKALEKTSLAKSVIESWNELTRDLNDLRHQMKSQKGAAFTFVEGILSQAIRNGDWLLLDEINLASPETLDCLSGVLESNDGSVALLEIGDAKPIKRHSNFRIFAAMNPATDIGKKNLPNSIRSRFLEIFVSEPNDDSDMLTIIGHYLEGRTAVEKSVVNGVLKFYREVCNLPLQDLRSGGATSRLHSLRSLCRALRYVTDNSKMTLNQALYEGLCLAFLTEIDHSQHEAITKLILRHVVGTKRARSVLNNPHPPPPYKYLTVEGYHLRCGKGEPCQDERYIVTPYVKKNLQVLCRAVSYGKYPILIQGETSTGKTSVIHYLASLTGNQVFRINNHEHTDLQEYIGSYSSDENGQFVFQEGPLVTAMRFGHWIILDELNLAPTDILESLNRVLDDNRELFIPETQERIVAHPRFALFATQNPPGVYGGRKVLSRALRNRFIELHFGQIPSEEVNTILHKRCDLPMSRCKKLINIMEELQQKRSASGIFAGKHSFITLRDLFKWAERYRCGHAEADSLGAYDWDQQLANDGFMLLAGRVRIPAEKELIKEAIEKHLNRKIEPGKIFSQNVINEILGENLPKKFEHVVFTQPLRRMIVMLHRALSFDEPVLLVGETGCGKTTACQLVSALLGEKNNSADLSIVNCHSHTDASDFLGGLRPVRHGKTTNDEDDRNKLFEWVDGPLVQAMLQGKSILIDEISLAEDSVLERLNSVLEPARLLVIPDRIVSGSCENDLIIKAKSGFQFMATMNPGGDFGKKELSPALRNRLTEIWCTAVDDDVNDIIEIIKHNLKVPLNLMKTFSETIVKFIQWFSSTNFGNRCQRSIRDIMKWIQFCNTCCSSNTAEDIAVSLIHGALLVFVDGVGSGISDSAAGKGKEARAACVGYILKLLEDLKIDGVVLFNIRDHFASIVDRSLQLNVRREDDCFAMGPFKIHPGPLQLQQSNNYSFKAPSTSMNTFRILRALQLSNPILLEGSPGIGKTSLVVALAKRTGHDVVRINLSEQTDMSDLLGADLPVEDGIGGQFSWRDGPLLTALKQGSWVIFDELNLASQSVLEGLNSVFDHRSEIYVPELGMKFNVQTNKTRIFGCQNPYYQGGGRKGLPKSFLNRFSQVYMEPLSQSDITMILSSQYPALPSDMICKMVAFNEEVKTQIVEKHQWGYSGSPWEFNLRDMTRWCELLVSKNYGFYQPEDFVYLIYCERLQTSKDRDNMFSLFEEMFKSQAYQPTCDFHLAKDALRVGNALIQREIVLPLQSSDTLILPSMLHSMESLITVLNQGWMAILTGGSGSGKSTLMKTLAALIGKSLKIFSVNSSMDATELLGGFEQMDFLRHLSSVPERIVSDVMEHCKAIPNLLEPHRSSHTAELLGVIHEIKKLQYSVMNCKDVVAALSCGEQVKSLLKDILIRCKNGILPSALLHCMERHEVSLANVMQKIEKSKGRFEWVDSELVEALKNGDWLLIEGANLCNPSVLDRLNALLEPGGLLSVTERGVIDGSFIQISPHPSFRLVLSLDSSEGNLSRAMRNRGVEIHLLSQDCSITDTRIAASMSWREVSKILECCLSFFPHNDMVRVSSFLLQLFRDIATSKAGTSSNAMLNCIRCAQEIAESLAMGEVIQSSLMRICSRYNDEETIQKLWESTEHLESSKAKMPVVRLNNIIHDSKFARLFYEGQFFNAIMEYCHQQKSSDVLGSAIVLFARLATCNDWNMRMEYVHQFVIHDQSDLEKYKHALSAVFDSSLFQDVAAKVGDKLDMLAMPWDLRLQKQGVGVFDATQSPCLSFTLNFLTFTFVNILYRYDLDKKLDALSQPTTQQKVLGKKKSKKNRNMKNQHGQQLGPLSLSVKYHCGLLKLQSLPDPSLVYIYPLYQSVSEFISNCTESYDMKQISVEDLNKILDAMSQIKYIWNKLISPSNDATSIILSVRRVQKAVSTFSNCFLNPDHCRVKESYSKLTELFHCINGSYKTNWESFRLQNKLRLLHGELLLDTLPCRSQGQVDIIEKGVQLLSKINDALRCRGSLPDDNGMHEHVIRICQVYANFSLEVDLFDKENMISEVALQMESTESAIIERLESWNNSDHEDATLTEADAGLSYVRDCSQSVLDISLYSIIGKCLHLLKFWDSGHEDGRIAIESHINEVITLLVRQRLLNARVLKNLFLILKACKLACSVPLQSKKLIVSHLLSLTMTLLCESELLEVYPQKSKCLSGAAILTKPFLATSCMKALSTSMNQYNCNTRTTLHNISAADLKIWTDISLPLSQYEAMLNMLKSVHCGLWKNSFSYSDSSMAFSSHKWLHRSCMLLFCHLSQVLSIFAKVDGIVNSVVDATLGDLFSLLLRKIFNLQMPECFQSVLQTLTVSCKQLHQAHLLENQTSQAGNDTHWLQQIKVSLERTMQFVILLVTKLSCCNENMTALDQKKLEIMILSYLGLSWIWTSAFSLLLCSPQNDIDPADMYDVKFSCLENQHEELWNDIRAYAMYRLTLTGHETVMGEDANISDKFVHPLLPLQYKSSLDVKRKLEKVQQRMAVRPQGNQLKTLVQLCKQTCDSFLSFENVAKITKDVENVIQSVGNDDEKFRDFDISGIISAFCGIRSNLTSFSDKLLEFPAFSDFCTPLLDTMNCFSLGCRFLENSLKSCETFNFEKSNGSTLETFFCSLMGIENRLTEIPGMISFSKNLQQQFPTNLDCESSSASLNFTENVLISLLLRLRNIVLFEGSLSPHMQNLEKLFDYIATEFDKQKEEEIRRNEEKASLYKIKSHLEDLTEEQIEEKEFFEIFGYRPGQEDTESVSTMEDGNKVHTKTQPKYSSNVWAVAMQIHQDISQLFGCALPENTLQATVDMSINITLPCVFACSKLQPLFLSCYDYMLDLEVDDMILNSNLMSVKQFCDSCTVESKDSCNIYVDPMTSEVKGALVILQNLTSHLRTTLLKEWPDNPVLLKIVEISNRISGFTISSPMIRFVNGMEILLGSVQEWEKNAHSEVSLQNFMDEIAQLICKWRRFELMNWGRLIEDEYKKLCTIKPSLFFSLYSLVLCHFEESDIKDFVTQLENFIESSDLAQFCPRLSLLDQFWRYLHLLGQGSSQIAICLKNVYSYYSQFSASVLDRLDAVRKPIEKDLKDLVAITKWSDRNFFTLKESVERTHRQLFKLIKKFSLAMKEKVHCRVLMQGSHSSNFSISQSIVQSSESTKLPVIHNAENSNQGENLVSDFLAQLDANAILSCPLLNRLPKILKKLSKVKSNCISSGISKFETGISCIEDFIGDVIATAESLKDAKPSTVAEKGDEAARAKRVSEAKNIKLRKQKALTDLFKHLSEMGLSFKKGLIHNRDLTPQELLLTPPPISETIVHLLYSSAKVSIVTKRDEADYGRDYFYSIIAKWCGLNMASGNPHRDLNKSALDRCNGFIGHLMNLSRSQRKLVNATMQSSRLIYESMDSLKIIRRSDQHCDQLNCISFMNESGDLVNHLCLLIEEFIMWLSCCPGKDSTGTVTDNCDSCENADQAKDFFHGSTKWSNIHDLAEVVSKESFIVKSFLDSIRPKADVVTKSLITETMNKLLSLQLQLVNFDVACKQELQSSSHAVIRTPKISHRFSSLLQSLEIHLEKHGDLIHFARVQHCSELNSQDVVDTLNRAELLVSNVLICVQKIKKSAEHSGSYEITDNHEPNDAILKSMHDEILDQIEKMTPESIAQGVQHFTQSLIESLPSLDSNSAQAMAASVLNVLGEYHSFLRYLQSSLSKTNRITMKLCHVISGIFVQLCQNGYCTPEDVQEDIDEGEGAELEDAEGGGVGDGEGANDVSDQIEDQEMLEDKPGEEQEDDGGSNIEASENAVEMENDFEGKFDDDNNQENTDQQSNEEEENVEKQLGELGNEQNQEKLDEQFWGSDEENEDDEEEKSNEVEEKGKGADKSQSELAAKDNELQAEEEEEEEEEEPINNEQEDYKPHDNSQFDPAETDPYDNENKESEIDENNLNLPDDLGMESETEEDNKETEDSADIPDPIQENNDDAGDNESDCGDNMQSEPNLDGEEADENDDEESEEADADAQDAIAADESSSKEFDNTISDSCSKDQNQESSKSEAEVFDQEEKKMPPQENRDERGNEGLSPTDNTDDTTTQTSRMDKKKPDDIQECHSKKRRPEPLDKPTMDDPMDTEVEKRLNMADPVNRGNDSNDMDNDEPKQMENNEYEHVHSPNASYDKKVLNSVSKEVDQKQEDFGIDDVNEIEGIDEMMDVDDVVENSLQDEDLKITYDVAVSSLSEIHTNISNTLHFERYMQVSEEEIDRRRKELEEQLEKWRFAIDPIKMQDALVAWQSYCSLTRPLAIELCEQLRLVLEPTQASQLKGDYRTGKRLNIRKMIPYIASGYRKDKIWLRRTKPNKRTYQVMLAVDDSSSMVDNHSKQLAFESVAVISGALSSLEVGDFSICSFGEEVQLLQNFGDTWSPKSGASVLTRCTFAQKKTKIAQFLDYSVDLFQSAQRMSVNASDSISQLLLIISDGRGLYLEGRKKVLESVSSIHKAGIFVAFIILDQPNHGQGSISDIKVPVFNKPGEMPEIHSYMKDFPFPFYVILRNINVLPQTLGEALRQWFVLVTGTS